MVSVLWLRPRHLNASKYLPSHWLSWLLVPITAILVGGFHLLFESGLPVALLSAFGYWLQLHAVNGWQISHTVVLILMPLRGMC
jgi:hypothetical protein